MNLPLSPELAQFVRTKVASGRYSSEVEVALAGIALLKELDSLYQGRYEEIKGKISEGALAAERGELIDSDYVFERMQAKLDSKSERSKPKRRLVEFIGAAKGSFASPAEVDAYIREERDAWDS